MLLLLRSDEILRIIGGEARGRRLIAPDGMQTRPTADKTRESLFNILARVVPGAKVADLFGGTGALALESLSRGAEFAFISDTSAAAIKAIERNAHTVLGDHAADAVQIVKADYKRAIERMRIDKYTLVFLDPPYALKDSYRDAVERLEKAGLLSRDAIIVMEKSKDTVIELPDSMEIYDERNYRDTVVAFARFKETET